MFTTNNTILLKHTENLPPIYCIQRKGNKVVPTETDMIQANKGSFGDAIGPITNVITSQICLQARFPKDSEEYKVLDYRILCGQLFQQNSIDKAKGIIAKPMPKHWYDNSYNRIEETDTPEEISKKEFNQRICADKKPYFFIYNYPTLMKEYKDYIKTSDVVSRSRFNIPLEELLSSQELTEEQAEFLKFYKEFYPVNAETCVVNELCWEIEKTLADVKESKVPFDSSILKSDATYTNKDKAFIKRIYDKYNKTYANRMSRHSSVYEDTSLTPIGMTFESECAEYVPDAEKLCNILVDLGYNTKKGKTFVWEMSGDSTICIHDGQTGIMQTSRKANDIMNFYNKCDERLAELVYANTSITKDFLDGIADREYYMFPEEAKELGIVDTIVGVDCPIDEIL